jgi:hypothetical protein
MLVLSRRTREVVRIGDTISLRLLSIEGTGDEARAVFGLVAPGLSVSCVDSPAPRASHPSPEEKTPHADSPHPGD